MNRVVSATPQPELIRRSGADDCAGLSPGASTEVEALLGGSMLNAPGSMKHDRFMPDWILGAVMRIALVPGLWSWGRANAQDWPGVDTDLVLAAEYWGVPLLPAPFVAQIAVWGAHIVSGLLVAGFLTRIVGLVLVFATAVYILWISPESWASAAVFGAIAFYLFARGGGALSLDGSLAATTR